MKLSDHPELEGWWPPDPGGAYEKATSFPGDGQDTLREVTLQPAQAGKGWIAIETEYMGTRHTRDLLLDSPDFATGLIAFLRQNIGRTIAEVGNKEIDF